MELKRRLYPRGGSYETTIPKPILFSIDQSKKHMVRFIYDDEKGKWYIEFEERDAPRRGRGSIEFEERDAPRRGRGSIEFEERDAPRRRRGRVDFEERVSERRGDAP